MPGITVYSPYHRVKYFTVTFLAEAGRSACYVVRQSNYSECRNDCVLLRWSRFPCAHELLCHNVDIRQMLQRRLLEVIADSSSDMSQTSCT